MSNIFSGQSYDDIKVITDDYKTNFDTIIIRHIIGLVDYTSLNVTDTDASIETMCDKLNNYPFIFPDLPAVAGICVYPRFVSTVKKNLNIPSVKIVSVAAGFPSSQIRKDIKIEEVKRATDEGADEIDIVMPVGDFLEGRYDDVKEEINSLKTAAGKCHLKVILETGILHKPELIYNASMLAMEAGADFIKTSTGKEKISASPEALYIMSVAALDYFKKHNKKIGIKPAGGISDTQTAFKYYAVVENVLGNQWLLPELFRFGASRLMNNLLENVEGREVEYF